MKHPHFLSVVLGISVLQLTSSVCQAQQEDRGRIEPAATVVDPALGQLRTQTVQPNGSVENASTGLAAELTSSETSAAVRSLGLNESAIAQGRVMAVENGSSRLVTPENLGGIAASGALFVERVQAVPAEAELPPVLVLNDSPTRALRLGYEVITRNSFGQNVTLTTWAREGTGLSLNGGTSTYVGSFFVALSNAAQSTDRSMLAAPVPIAITATGATSVTPRPLEISTLGQWYEASIEVPSIDGERYALSVSADPSDPGDSVNLSVTRPTITLSGPRSIIGWGIGQATIDIEVAGVRNVEGMRVSLLADNGGLTSSSVLLDATGHASTELRSNRAAEAQVSVVRPADAEASPLVVTFEPPWIFLSCALSGGLLGAFLRGRGRQHWIKALAIGAGSGSVMTLAFAVGINWPERALGISGLADAGEAVVFVLGVLGALTGVSTLINAPQPNDH